MTQLDPEAERLRVFELLKNDLPTFAKHCLKIRDKQGKIIPLVFNKAQLYTHACLEAQRQKLGFVRAIIIKGRQQGLSTAISARFFQKTLLESGTSTFILAHQSKSTLALLDIVKRYIEFLPEGFCPGLDTANKNQIKFTGTASEYSVGTAGSEAVGRGMTIRLMHLSECGFYESSDELQTGLMQAVADLPGTEILIESTANGITNYLYRATMAALTGQGLYQVIFIPWHWEEGYRLPLPPGFSLEPSEQIMKETYNLTDEQIYWRRKKTEDLGSPWKTAQEFPNDIREAFLVSGESFFNKESLSKARFCKVTSPNAPAIMGVDCARTSDRSVFVIRKGRSVIHYEVHKDLKATDQAPTQHLVSIAARLINKYDVKKVFIDAGYGYGVVDGLHTLGYRKEVMAVNFAQQPMDKVRFLNKRAEIYGLARDAIEEGNISIPDTDEFMFDLLLTPTEKKSPTNRIYLPPKEEIRAKHGVSPDLSDSYCLTYSFPVAQEVRDSDVELEKRNQKRKVSRETSALTTINRLRQKC